MFNYYYLINYKMNYDEKCQLLIVGDSYVGKTSILSRYANGTFNENYLSTLGLDSYSKDETINGKTIRVNVWDTAGQERYKALTKGFFRNAQGIMVVFDVTNQETFENVKFWIESIKTNIGSEIEKTPIIIIGNKIDSEREFEKDVAVKFCKEANYPYYETSAKTGENIDSTIIDLVKLVLNCNSDNKNNNNENIKIKAEEHKNNKKSGCSC